MLEGALRATVHTFSLVSACCHVTPSCSNETACWTRGLNLRAILYLRPARSILFGSSLVTWAGAAVGQGSSPLLSPSRTRAEQPELLAILHWATRRGCKCDARPWDGRNYSACWSAPFHPAIHRLLGSFVMDHGRPSSKITNWKKASNFGGGNSQIGRTVFSLFLFSILPGFTVGARVRQ